MTYRAIGKFTVLLLITWITLLPGNEEDLMARPLYFKVWKKVYERKAGCSVCHPVRDKRRLNDYGMRLQMELGRPNVKDEAIIEEAIRKIVKKRL